MDSRSSHHFAYATALFTYATTLSRTPHGGATSVIRVTHKGAAHLLGLLLVLLRVLRGLELEELHDAHHAHEPHDPHDATRLRAAARRAPRLERGRRVRAREAEPLHEPADVRDQRDRRDEVEPEVEVAAVLGLDGDKGLKRGKLARWGKHCRGWGKGGEGENYAAPLGAKRTMPTTPRICRRARLTLT